MRRILASLVAVGAVMVAGCNLDLTNRITHAGRRRRESAGLYGPLIAGVMSAYRAGKAGQIQDFGSFGREIYNMFITDGRSITGPYRDWRQNNAFAAGSQWAAGTRTTATAYEALKIINNTRRGSTTPGRTACLGGKAGSEISGFPQESIAPPDFRGR